MRASDPCPSIEAPRRHLLGAVLEFVQASRACPGVARVALVGSLATDKLVPKDADVLVTVAEPMDLAPIARAGRRRKGQCQSANLGADIFLADQAGRYFGRICHYRECHPRAACRAQHCGPATTLERCLARFGHDKLLGHRYWADGRSMR